MNNPTENMYSVEDILPEDNSIVVAYCNDNVKDWHVVLGYKNNQFIDANYDEYPAIVTHWAYHFK